MASDISINLELNPSGYIQGLNSAANATQNFAQVTGMNIANPSNLPVIANASGIQQPLLGPVSSNNDYLSREKSENLTNALYDLITTLKERNPVPPTGPNTPNPNYRNTDAGKMLSQITAVAGSLLGLTQGLVAYSNSRKKIGMRELEADVYGAQIEDISGTGNAWKSALSASGLVGSGIGGVIGTAIFPGVGTAIGSFVGKSIGDLLEKVGDGIVDMVTQTRITNVQENQTKVDLYKNRLSVMEDSLLRYGNGNYSNGNMIAIQDRLNQYATDTGVSLDEFMGNANSLARYGIKDSEVAGSLTRAASLASRNTGADKSSILNFLGTQQRYAGGNGRTNMNYAYSAALETGLTKDQFGEFLDGLENVIESGISKGYISSSKDVADTMVMFSKMSNNDPLWSGEIGFQMYNKMQSGMANATNLSNSSQMLMYQAMRGLTGNSANAELDTLKMMEGDLTVDKFKAINGIADKYYANDYLSKVSFYKNSFGLNWTQADKLASMDPSKMTNSKLKEVIADEKNDTDATKMQNALNNISNSVATIAKAPFNDYLLLLESIAGKNSDKSEDIKKTTLKDEFLALYPKAESAYDGLSTENVKTMIAAGKNPDNLLYQTLQSELEKPVIAGPAARNYELEYQSGMISEDTVSNKLKEEGNQLLERILNTLENPKLVETR